MTSPPGAAPSDRGVTSTQKAITFDAEISSESGAVIGKVKYFD